MPLGLLTMTPTTIRTAKQMRDGLMQGGYYEQAHVIDDLIKMAEGDTVPVHTDGKSFTIGGKEVSTWEEALGIGKG
jgi:hypothetical protein